jgi:alpha-L-arabinofuranosidase
MRATGPFSATVLLAAALVVPASAQNLVVYDELLHAGWQSWSWAAVNFYAQAPAHGGVRSIEVRIRGAGQALALHHATFPTSSYEALAFWIHGGSAGGQRLQLEAVVDGVARPPVPLAAYLEGGVVPVDGWTRVAVPLSDLGAARTLALTELRLRDAAGAAQPAFYLDDIALVAVPGPEVVSVAVDAAHVVRLVDECVFGVNAAIWDGAFAAPETTGLLAAAGVRTLRFPGGSLANEYHWKTNTTLDNTWTWATDFDAFAAVATALQAQVFISVNYGTGTPAEAADWVTHANVEKGCGLRHWEIGNENYGLWETDAQAVPHDPYTYALRSRDYIAAMKAADPAVRVGVVAVTGEDSYANSTAHLAVNPRTGHVHSGWTPVLLATLRSLGVTPDFVAYHRYEQGPGEESDAVLLQSAQTWPLDVADLRGQLADYLGDAGAGVELVVTENNSVYTRPGKQTTSLVNALFLADAVGIVLQTEINAFVWWDARNSQEHSNNNGGDLFGWRAYGDYGVIATPLVGGSSSADEPYPTYFAFKLLAHFARGGDAVVHASSDHPLLAVYAARRHEGPLSLLVINKSPTRTLDASIAISGFVPGAVATVRSYGIPQDEAARTGVGSPDLTESTLAVPGAVLTAAFSPYSATVVTIPAGFTPRPVRRIVGRSR